MRKVYYNLMRNLTLIPPALAAFAAGGPTRNTPPTAIFAQDLIFGIPRGNDRYGGAMD